MDLTLTTHAQERMNQRGISRETMELIYEYGTDAHDHRGGVRIMVPKKKIASLAKKLPSIKRSLEKAKGIYLVVSSLDGAVITAGHRYA